MRAVAHQRDARENKPVHRHQRQRIGEKRPTALEPAEVIAKPIRNQAREKIVGKALKLLRLGMRQTPHHRTAMGRVGPGGHRQERQRPAGQKSFMRGRSMRQLMADDAGQRRLAVILDPSPTAHRAAHAAAAAVAPDHETRLHGDPIAELQPGFGRIGRDRRVGRQSGPKLQLDARMRVHRRRQRPADRPILRDISNRIRRFARMPQRVSAEPQAARGVAIGHGDVHDRLGVARHARPNIQRAQRLGGAERDGRSAPILIRRAHIGGLRVIHHQCVDAGLRQCERGDAADQAAADDTGVCLNFAFNHNAEGVPALDRCPDSPDPSGALKFCAVPKIWAKIWRKCGRGRKAGSNQCAESRKYEKSS